MVVKTHTGIVITKDGKKRMKLHESATAWVVKGSEYYDKKTGVRGGASFGKRHLLLDTLRPISKEGA